MKPGEKVDNIRETARAANEEGPTVDMNHLLVCVGVMLS